jgi:hypothetical protein
MRRKQQIKTTAAPAEATAAEKEKKAEMSHTTPPDTNMTLPIQRMPVEEMISSSLIITVMPPKQTTEKDGRIL